MLSYSISSGALVSPGLLPSYSMIMITFALHNTIKLIINHLPTPKSLTNDTGTYGRLSSQSCPIPYSEQPKSTTTHICH